MKKTLILSLFLSLLAWGLLPAQTPSRSDRVVVAYVTAWTDVMPDPTLMTHIN